MTISTRLDGQRILLTQAHDFMGPALTEVFTRLGATVIADARPLADDAAAPTAMVAAAGQVDVLVLHLSLPAPSTPAQDVSDTEWREVFAHLVDPMPRLVAAVLPQMLARRAGRILLMGSAGALRGQRRTASYSAARGAQLAYVQSVGLELAARSAYAPQAGATLWRKMGGASSANIGKFLSSHPSGPQRVKDLEANAPKVQVLYENARKRG